MKESWLASKQKEVAEAKGKLLRLDEAYIKKRGELRESSRTSSVCRM